MKTYDAKSAAFPLVAEDGTIGGRRYDYYRPSPPGRGAGFQPTITHDSTLGLLLGAVDLALVRVGLVCNTSRRIIL